MFGLSSFYARISAAKYRYLHSIHTRTTLRAAVVALAQWTALWRDFVTPMGDGVVAASDCDAF